MVSGGLRTRVDLMAVANLEAVLTLLEDAGSEGPITADTVWDAVREVVKERKLKARSEIMLQLRHALTGQKVCHIGHSTSGSR